LANRPDETITVGTADNERDRLDLNGARAGRTEALPLTFETRSLQPTSQPPPTQALLSTGVATADALPSNLSAIAGATGVDADAANRHVV